MAGRSNPPTAVTTAAAILALTAPTTAVACADHAALGLVSARRVACSDRVSLSFTALSSANVAEEE